MPPTRLTVNPAPVTTTWKPARAPSPAADALTPLLIGLEVGVVALLGLGAVGALVAWPLDIILRFAPAVGVGGLIGGLAYGFETVHGTLHETIETVTGRDLDGDGDIGGKPDPLVLHPRLPYSATERADADLWKFIEWSYGHGGKTSLEAVTAAGILTETAWTECRRRLIAAGVTADTRAGDTAGWRLTPETAQDCWYLACQHST